jgi:hypothetical protein
MDPTVKQWNFKEHDEVRSGDDHKLGKVVAFWPDMVSPTHLVVEGGFLFHHDYYIPISAVTTYNGNQIFIDATKEQVQVRGWDAPPVDAWLAAAGEATPAP